MPQAGSILSNVRKLFGDPDLDFITDAVGLDWLDQAQRRFCQEVMALDEYKDYTVTAKADKFDLPTNAIIPIWLMWYQSRVAKLDYATPDQWARIIENQPTSTGIPEWYTVIRKQVQVGPQVPSTASKTSTASGTITASGTTISVVTATGQFRTKGFVKINSEVLEYTALGAAQLTGATRGVHGTTATSHASGDTVTQVDLMMLYRKTPAALATSALPDVPEMFHDYLEKYVLYLAWLARGDQSKAGAAYGEFEKLEQSAVKTVARRALDGTLKVQDKRARRRWW